MLRKLKLLTQPNDRNSYATLAFKQGPRLKSTATMSYENLIKDILQAFQSERDIQANYNSQNEIEINANGHFYNLAQILKAQPDFEQLQFDEVDLAIYDKFLRDPKTKNGHIENDAAPYELEKMSQAFPNMTRAEMSAIRHYTESFYELMNYLIKSEGQGFPAYEYQSIAAAVQEVLLGTAFTVSALSKPVQEELNIGFAASLNELNKNFKNIKGINLILIPKDNQHELIVVAYGSIINKPGVMVDISKLLSTQSSQLTGVVLLADEIKEISSQLQPPVTFSLFENIDPLIKTKFIDILTSIDNIDDLLYEKIFRVDEDPKYFSDNYLTHIQNTINTSNCTHHYKVFYSASTGVLDGFKSPGFNIVTTLINPITFGKNIETISAFYSEHERLLIPGQQYAYTAISSTTDQYGLKETALTGFPIRSIEDKTQPEITPSVTPTKRQTYQISSASRVQPFYSGMGSWAFSATKSASSFLARNLIEKPMKELGKFAQFYLEYLQTLTVEQVAMNAISSNPHSLFSSARNLNLSSPLPQNVTLTLRQP